MQQPMKASPKDLFEGRKHFEVPPYQRPYVWDEDEQWAPLWDDIVRVAESHVRRDAQLIAAHFLGAIVFKLASAESAGLTRYTVIDGQQRLTTIQIALDAARTVLEERGHASAAELLGELTRNDQADFKNTSGRFKLWPSRGDQSAFEQVMDGKPSQGKDPHRLHLAHGFFRKEVARWLDGAPTEEGYVPPGDEKDRAKALKDTLASRLMLVAIDLSNDDDDQLVFETLNDRGTPLLKADLIKNWVFLRGRDLGADTDRWANEIWDDFDTEWWRHEIAQGRLSRSRVDIFLQYWLTMRTMDEVKSEMVFRIFQQYAKSRMSTVDEAEAFLTELRNDANTYRGLADLDRSTPEGRFRAQVIESMELAATMPVFLWFISANHKVPADQLAIGLAALESWVTRRTLLRLTTKDVNRFMVVLLKELDKTPVESAGTRLRELISEQTAESRYWPSDAELRSALPGIRLYGNVKQSRLVAVLGTVEELLRASNAKVEDLALPAGLSLEHVMPRGWRTHWNTEPPLTLEQETERDLIVHTIGNLTIVTGSLNSALSNRPWTDTAATGIKDGGRAGLGKRSLLTHSLLAINKGFIDGHQEAWTEQDIRDRGEKLVELITQAWPGPDSPAKAQA